MAQMVPESFYRLSFCMKLECDDFTILVSFVTPAVCTTSLKFVNDVLRISLASRRHSVCFFLFFIPLSLTNDLTI